MDDGAQEAVVQWFRQQLKEFFVDGYTNLCISGTPVSSPVVIFSNCCNTLILYAYWQQVSLPWASYIYISNTYVNSIYLAKEVRIFFNHFFKKNLHMCRHKTV